MQIGILSPELKSIEQLFAGNARFSVPRYQRSFAWTADETEELWEDLFRAVEREGEYFLGTVVLHRTATGHSIIDGQQRLACIVMLFSAVRNVFMSQRDGRAQQIDLSFLGSKDFTRDATIDPKLALNKINNETFLQYILQSPDLDKVDLKLKSKDRYMSTSLRHLEA